MCVPVHASMWHPCGTRGTLKEGCKRPVHRRLGTVAPFFAKNPVRASRLAYDTRYPSPFVIYQSPLKRLYISCLGKVVMEMMFFLQNILVAYGTVAITGFSLSD